MTRFLLVVMFAVFLVLPGMAQAQTAAIPGEPQCSSLVENAQNNMTAHAQAKAAAIHNFYSGIPRLDLQVNYCITQIEKLFDVAVGIGDPLGIVGAIATNMLVNMANQVCQAALQTVTSVINAGLSQFNRLCVPLPNLNLNLKGLSLQGPACNGVNLLGVKTSVGGGGLPPSVWQIWNSSQGSGSNGQ